MSDVDLFGDPISVDFKLRQKYIEPPFSVLDTKGGSWQSRKRQWKSIGIKSELGRDGGLSYNTQSWIEEKSESKFLDGTSIFDPVLCELMYLWFCPDGGKILDPFAGGSVRGIVANLRGYDYTGIELQQNQVDSNREQASDVLEINNQPQWYVGDSEKILEDFIDPLPSDGKIKISVKSLKQKFQICEPEYIKNVCHGRCCEGSNGLMVTIHDSEKEKFEAMGVGIEGNFIKDDGCGICPLKAESGLCSVHEEKPFGCKSSPFTLNKNNTLIIRNRYRLLGCYNTPDAKPAYISHRWSLEQIFGKEETNNIIQKIESGSDDFYVDMDKSKHKIIIDNDLSKHPGRRNGELFDFVFSCPPYHNLEVYSDSPDDLSNMGYNEFLIKYRNIIDKTVQRLKIGCYACFVVSEIRKKDGNYRGFVKDTIQAFEDAGCNFYNDIILLGVVGSGSMRCDKQFSSGKKIVSVHQNILVFKKSGCERLS